MKNIPNLNIDDVDDEENLVQKKFTKSIKSKQNNKSTSHEGFFIYLFLFLLLK